MVINSHPLYQLSYRGMLCDSTEQMRFDSSAPSNPGVREAGWLPGQDSNLDKEIQSLRCYRYTTRQFRKHPQISM